jgi:beta-galactosidase
MSCAWRSSRGAAWSRAKGAYDFGWLDRAFALAGERGLSVVLGTPTATPPAWLTAKYPDTLQHTQNVRVAQHGARCHFKPVQQPTYRRLASNIAGVVGRTLRFCATRDRVARSITNTIRFRSMKRRALPGKYFCVTATAIWRR